jgi:hypothetical protein
MAMVTRHIAWALVVLSGCGGGEDAPRTRAPGGEAPADTTGPAAPEEPGEARATEIRVINDTAHPAVLERTFGPAEPLAIVRLDGPLDPTARLEQEDDARSHRWVATCGCPCGEGACPRCEPPMLVRETLAPDGAYTLPWSGRLVRYRQNDHGDTCAEPFAPPAGRYLLTACTLEHGCARGELSLPASAPIELRLSSAATLAACGDVSVEAMERAGAGLRSSLRHVLRERPLDRCPARPQCVAPDAIDAALRDAHDAPCSLFVVPRGRELEAILLAPLPAGWDGGEQFRQWLDPDATRVLRARYEQ